MDNIKTAHEFLVSKGIKSMGEQLSAHQVEEWLEEYKSQSAPAPVGEEEAAENYANNEGYPKSDKEHFETTYWTQHNIAAKGFKAGIKYASLKQLKTK